MKESKMKPKRICLYGPFGMGNLGNESTLQAILYNLRKNWPDAAIICICTDPEATAATHNVAAVPISGIIGKPWMLRNPLARFVRKVFVGIPREPYRWIKAFKTLKGADMLIVSGMGLLTDAYGLFGWGPYNIFKWSAIAKLCRCKLLFVSVGAGPIYGALGKFFVKSALSLADFRTYRDNSTVKYLINVGFQAHKDRVYPDLAFSLPKDLLEPGIIQKTNRRVVGVGLMSYTGKYSVANPTGLTYFAYLKKIVIFVRWLLAHDYDIRLLISDIHEGHLRQELKDLLKQHAVPYHDGRIIDEPIVSVEGLLSQLASTDVVVATRFHNVLLALMLDKPVISISFHHKCTSLMGAMGLAEYCQDIHRLDADRLIDQFCNLENNVEQLRPLINQKTEEFRRALDEQYNSIFKDISCNTR